MANGTLKVSNIETSSGSGTITLGQSGETVDFSNATTTLNSAMKNTPAFRVTNASVQSIPNNTWTKVTFDTEDYDTDTAFASSTFTVPTGEAGKYLFNWIVYAEVDSGEGVASRLYINSYADNKTYARAMSSGSGEATLNTASVTVSLSAADTVELYMYQNKGSAQNNNVSYTNFGGYKLIGA